MNEQRPYGILPPGASRFKRKDMESILPPAKRPPPPRAAAAAASATTKTSTGSKGIGIEIASTNKLLAGYLAYEFLTEGTVLGQELDAARSETGIRPVTEPRTPVNGGERYREVASLLMMKTDDGGHVPGIVNPAQLWRWIEM